MKAYQAPALPALAFALALAGAPPASAGTGVVDLEVDGSSLTGTISLAGTYLVDLEITFEDVSGLDLATLDVSARVLSPLDLLLRRRLPSGAGIPLALPVVLSIEPKASSSLALHGTYTIDLHTHNLTYLPGTPLRLFKAPRGGAFEDITQAMGVGSYRVRGSSGCFSDFLIVLDLRTSPAVIGTKYGALESELEAQAASIPSAVHGELASLLASSQGAYLAGDPSAAVAFIEAFAATVEANSGAGGIPDAWQANSSLHNVAGELRTKAGTLRFSLLLAGG